jgi:hypothetical protein
MSTIKHHKKLFLWKMQGMGGFWCIHSSPFCIKWVFWVESLLCVQSFSNSLASPIYILCPMSVPSLSLTGHCLDCHDGLKIGLFGFILYTFLPSYWDKHFVCHLIYIKEIKSKYRKYFPNTSDPFIPIIYCLFFTKEPISSSL